MASAQPEVPGIARLHDDRVENLKVLLNNPSSPPQKTLFDNVLRAIEDNQHSIVVPLETPEYFHKKEMQEIRNFYHDKFRAVKDLLGGGSVPLSNAKTMDEVIEMAQASYAGKGTITEQETVTHLMTEFKKQPPLLMEKVRNDYRALQELEARLKRIPYVVNGLLPIVCFAIGIPVEGYTLRELGYNIQDMFEERSALLTHMISSGFVEPFSNLTTYHIQPKATASEVVSFLSDYDPTERVRTAMENYQGATLVLGCGHHNVLDLLDYQEDICSGTFPIQVYSAGCGERHVGDFTVALDVRENPDVVVDLSDERFWKALLASGARFTRVIDHSGGRQVTQLPIVEQYLAQVAPGVQIEE